MFSGTLGGACGLDMRSNIPRNEAPHSRSNSCRGGRNFDMMLLLFMMLVTVVTVAGTGGTFEDLNHNVTLVPSPTPEPTLQQTQVQTSLDTSSSSQYPLAAPTPIPTQEPTPEPSNMPTAPSPNPTTIPTPVPSMIPTWRWTRTPSLDPTFLPTGLPTVGPTRRTIYEGVNNSDLKAAVSTYIIASCLVGGAALGLAICVVAFRQRRSVTGASGTPRSGTLNPFEVDYHKKSVEDDDEADDISVGSESYFLETGAKARTHLIYL